MFLKKLVCPCFLHEVAIRLSAYLFSSFAVYIRDLKNVIGILVTTIMFLTPVLYPPSLVLTNEKIAWFGKYLILLNPLAYNVENFRRTVVYEQLPTLSGLIVGYVSGFLLLCLAYRLFVILQDGFADIL